MKPLLNQILSDSDGKGSATRVTLFALLALLIAMAIGVFFFHANFNHDIWSDVFFAVLIFGGYNKSEKFANIIGKNKENNSTST